MGCSGRCLPGSCKALGCGGERGSTGPATGPADKSRTKEYPQMSCLRACLTTVLAVGLVMAFNASTSARAATGSFDCVSAGLAAPWLYCGDGASSLAADDLSGLA